jgi:hypothetical protein
LTYWNRYEILSERSVARNSAREEFFQKQSAAIHLRRDFESDSKHQARPQEINLRQTQFRG